MQFLLVLVSPEEAIALAQSAQGAQGADVDVAVVLLGWAAETRLMLSFYLRHPDITVLSNLRAWHSGRRVLSGAP